MNSLWGIRLVVESFLLVIVLHKGSAEPDNYQTTAFRARQSEAKRNRIKYPYEDDVEINSYTGFLMKNDFTEFVLPTLSNDDKLEQIFTLNGEKFDLVCTGIKGLDFTVLTSLQINARNVLQSKSLYIYEVIPPKHPSFTLVPRPLTKAEEKIILHKYGAEQMCERPPMPAIQEDKEIRKKFRNRIFDDSSFTYFKYGKDKKTCIYFQLGIETHHAVFYEIPGEITHRKHFHWAPSFKICHDVKNSVTAFTQHTIKWDHLINRKLNLNIKVNPYEEKVNVSSDYDQYYDLKNQQESFKAPGCKKEQEEFDQESNYLVRAHLIPDHDTLYESFQYTTNNYLNYVPQWRSVNMGQWLNIEQDIRYMALKLKKDVTIYTGAYYGKNPCTLTIPVEEEVVKNPSSSSKTKVELKSMQIPSKYFKYVHTDKAGIVIITSNGVSDSLDEIKCRDVCAQYGWLYGNSDYQHRKNVSSGQTKCCIPDDFFNQKEIKHSLPSLPKGKLARSKILTFDGHEVEVIHKDELPQGIGYSSGRRGGAMFLDAIGSPDKSAFRDAFRRTVRISIS